MITTLAMLVLCASPFDDAQAALIDRAKFPASEHPYLYYLTTATEPEASRFKLEAVMNFVVPSMSHKPLIDNQIPVKVGDTLYRIDTRELGWEHTLPKILIQHYPYAKHVTSLGLAPLCIRADWVAVQLSDPNEVLDGYYLLLYGEKPPKNVSELQKFWRVQSDSQFALGLIEGKSGVAVKGHRTLENRPAGTRGYAWLTKDSARIEGKTDPLENLLPGQVRFDASEWILGVPKYTAGKSGVLQAYFLADGKGNRVDKAPGEIVTDHLQTRTAEIRNFTSCIGCHASGINAPSVDEYREYLVAGARIHAYDRATKEQIEAYLEGDLGKEIRRNNEDYEAGVDLACGYPAAVVSGFFTGLVRRYDADVTLEQAALELGSDPRELSLAIAWANENYVPLSARAAQLAHGKAMPRDRWEQDAFAVGTYLQKWRAK